MALINRVKILFTGTVDEQIEKAEKQMQTLRVQAADVKVLRQEAMDVHRELLKKRKFTNDE